MKSAHRAILNGMRVLNASWPRREKGTEGVGDESSQGLGRLRLRLVHDGDVHPPKVGPEATHEIGAAGGKLLDLNVT